MPAQPLTCQAPTGYKIPVGYIKGLTYSTSLGKGHVCAIPGLPEGAVSRTSQEPMEFVLPVASQLFTVTSACPALSEFCSLACDVAPGLAPSQPSSWANLDAGELLLP